MLQIIPDVMLGKAKHLLFPLPTGSRFFACGSEWHSDTVSFGRRRMRLWAWFLI